MSASESQRIDELFDAVSAAERRYLLYLLLENEYVNVDDVAIQIAAWKRDGGVDAGAENDHDTLNVQLVHNHLPRLADYGFVEYDHRSGDVVRGDRFDDVAPAVERLRELDSEAELTEENVGTVLACELMQ